MKTLFLAVFAALLVTLPCMGGPRYEGSRFHGDDWTQWGGPNRNFSSDETGYSPYALSGDLEILWETNLRIDSQETRDYFGGSPVVIGFGWLYTIGARENEMSLFCINPTSGKVRWITSLQDKPNFYPMVQASPVVDGNFIFTFGPDGDVFCLESAGGDKRWHTNIEKECMARNVYDVYRATQGWGGFWTPLLSSPIVMDDKLIIHGNTVLVALDKITGEQIWSHTDDYVEE